MAPKKGLGRGIGSLIDGAYDEPKNNKEKIKTVEKTVEIIKEVKVNEPLMLKIRDVEPNREQPRKNFDDAAITELAESIKQYGIIQPIIVKQDGRRYVIIAGERRWRAAKEAGLKEVPAVVKQYTDREVMEIALVENIQRQDLNPVEEAMAYKRLIDEYQLTQEEVAGKVGRGRATVSNSMRLLALPQPVLDMLADGRISTGHAKALLEVKDEEELVKLAQAIENGGLSVRETERLVKTAGMQKKEKPVLPNAQTYADIEDRLRQRLCTKVNIKRSGADKGRIEIDYTSAQELESILERIL